MPTIDPNVEEPAREMLGHAIRGELEELAAVIVAAGSERYRQAVRLFHSVAAYVAVDASGRWPTDADMREIARLISERGTAIKLEESEVYGYLSGPVLDFKPLPESLGRDVAAATLPVMVTGSMLFTFRPDGQNWWDYLDQIWSAYEKAEAVDVTVLPALQVRAKMLQAAGGRPASE